MSPLPQWSSRSWALKSTSWKSELTWPCRCPVWPSLGCSGDKGARRRVSCLGFRGGTWVRALSCSWWLRGPAREPSDCLCLHTRIRQSERGQSPCTQNRPPPQQRQDPRALSPAIWRPAQERSALGILSSPYIQQCQLQCAVFMKRFIQGNRCDAELPPPAPASAFSPMLSTFFSVQLVFVTVQPTHVQAAEMGAWKSQTTPGSCGETSGWRLQMLGTRLRDTPAEDLESMLQTSFPFQRILWGVGESIRERIRRNIIFESQIC